jgi:hypothetical protein
LKVKVKTEEKSPTVHKGFPTDYFLLHQGWKWKWANERMESLFTLTGHSDVENER